MEGLEFHSFALVGDVTARAAIAATTHLDLVFMLGGPLVPITVVFFRFFNSLDILLHGLGASVIGFAVGFGRETALLSASGPWMTGGVGISYPVLGGKVLGSNYVGHVGQ